MKQDAFYTILEKNFGHKPNKDQSTALKSLSTFLVDKTQNGVFILKGYAGTGKTSIIKTLFKSLKKLNKNNILIAPTGRAAKVITSYTGSPANTIHHKIFSTEIENGKMIFSLKQNNQKNTVYIVDEASMISDNPKDNNLLNNASLLDDLLSYVFSDSSNKLIFIGDTAQLPPVKSNESPALDGDKILFLRDVEVTEAELKKVERQASLSGILHNATLLREQLENNPAQFKFELNDFKDIIRLQDSYEIENAIVDSYSQFGREDTCVLVYSNKRANMYNKQIRSKILGFDSDIVAGDYLMIVKNNYFWLPDQFTTGFIANGDIIEVLKIKSIENLYGFQFAKATIKMLDYPTQKPFDTVLLLDTIHSESPSLSYEDGNKLYEEIMKDYVNESSKYKRFMKVKSNPYFNALQVKFSYAITCHKAQGGQWGSVIVEQSYLPDGITREYLRWLYTAITRASKKAYLIGFKDSFFED